MTGVSSLQTELVAKRLQVLKTLAPTVRRVWLIYYGVDLSTTPMIAKALEAAQRMKVELVPKGVLDAGELKQHAPRGPARRRGARAGGLEPGSGHRDHRALAGPAHSRPSSGRRSGSAMAGSRPTAPTTTRRACRPAALVAKILRAARPQDLPVEGAERIDLAVNLKTADLLGITVPRKILLRADAFRR